MASGVLTSPRQQWQSWIVTIVLATTLLAPVGQAGHSNPNHNGDFEGDGYMNPTVYNEDTGEWRTLLQSTDYEPVSFTLGGPGWSAIQADYDGDGKADAATYNRATGEWIAMLSGLAYATGGILFGGAGWNVVTGDFDGDGTDDPALYREADGQWAALLSTRGYAMAAFVFGGPGYSSVSGDYDGDGLSDPALYRREDGLWQIACSSLNYTGTNICIVDCLGNSPLVPVPLDYDGDGKTDPAVFAYGTGASTGKQYVFGWFVTHSSLNYQQRDPFYHLGREDCQDSNADPTPGDYDGDGKGDYGVSWPDNSIWRMWRSSRDWENDHCVDDWHAIGFRPVQR
ncbi:MAG: hypothetical protein KKG09_06575 [Verrucomicrobia bacterium]|nr:hypothetical protein [Verrucomicrobiota bacterium]MCG2680639.1 hypothetical protein [Kiritimatiellia bacterium]MBU4247436.1 hypothetical protein [Verrucomicrobiota bacterium]MBU4291494.1 hypothetical protein [Verrucomicrobiota bacterium]MBU4429677.1 hypothetical protein [Verrucomicrobiota bacterium]